MRPTLSRVLTLKSWDVEFEHPLTDFIAMMQEQLAHVPERDWEAVSIKFEDGKLSLLLYPEGNADDESDVGLAWAAYWEMKR